MATSAHHIEAIRRSHRARSGRRFASATSRKADPVRLNDAGEAVSRFAVAPFEADALPENGTAYVASAVEQYATFTPYGNDPAAGSAYCESRAIDASSRP